MSKLGECTQCTKYRTAQCLGVTGFDGTPCRYYDSKDNHSASSHQKRQTPRSSPRKAILWSIYAALAIVCIWLFFKNKDTNIHDAITIMDAEQMGLYHDNYVAWSCPEGFSCDTLDDGTWVFHRTDTILTDTDTLFCHTSFHIVGFSQPQYTDIDQTAAMLDWSQYKYYSDLTTDNATLPVRPDDLGGEYCHLSPLDYNTQFAWNRAYFNWPADDIANNDIVLTLGTLYHPSTHSGCHIYYTSVQRAEDYTYDIYTLVRFLKQ